MGEIPSLVYLSLSLSLSVGRSVGRLIDPVGLCRRLFENKTGVYLPKSIRMRLLRLITFDFVDVMPHIKLYSERHGEGNNRLDIYAVNRLARNLSQKVEPSEALSFFEELDRLSFLNNESIKTSFLRSLIKGYIIR